MSPTAPKCRVDGCPHWAAIGRGGYCIAHATTHPVDIANLQSLPAAAPVTAPRPNPDWFAEEVVAGGHFARYIDPILKAINGAYGAVLEEACERSLVDPAQRGVLVTRKPPTIALEYAIDFDNNRATFDPGWVVTLSAEVPWGTIEIHEAAS